MVEIQVTTEGIAIQGKTYHSFREAIGPEVYNAFMQRQHELPPYLQTVLEERKFPNAKFTYFETYQDGKVADHLFMTQTTIGQGELIADLNISALPETGFFVNNLYFRPSPESAVINLMEEVTGTDALAVLTPEHKYYYDTVSNILFLGSIDRSPGFSRPYGIEAWLHEVGHLKHMKRYPEQYPLSLGKNGKLILTYAMYRMSKQDKSGGDEIWTKYEPYINQIIAGEKAASAYARDYLQHMKEQSPPFDLGFRAGTAEHMLTTALASYIRVFGKPEMVMQGLSEIGIFTQGVTTSDERLAIFKKTIKEDKRLVRFIQGIKNKIRNSVELSNEEAVTAALAQHMFFYH